MTNKFYMIQFYSRGELVYRFVYEVPDDDAVLKFVERIEARILTDEPFQIPIYHQDGNGQWLVFAETIYYHMGCIDRVEALKGTIDDLKEIANLEWEPKNGLCQSSDLG